MTTSDADDVRPENSGDLSVQSVPLDTEDGGTVVIEQQNVGPRNQVGGGEFKNVNRRKSPDEAAEEQDELQAEAAIEAGGQRVGNSNSDVEGPNSL